jgi:tetratricopeptide (TPR) repeat protein
VTSGKPATVSLCMIVRNEEHQLSDCLRPVAALFDEIVIVDTGSHDATREVAARFTPHVFDFPWCDHFSAARNEALRRSNGDWIFWLDADDRVSAEDVERLQRLFQQLGDEPRAYMMNTVCSSQYACEGVHLITHPRLFRRHVELCWQGRVHEQLRPAPIDLGYEQVWSDIEIRHVGYQDPAVKQRKLNRDLRLLRMDYAVDPDDMSTLVHLGLTYFHLGRVQQARTTLQHLLKLDKSPGEHLRQVYGVLATMEMQEGNLLDMLTIVDQGLQLFPTGEYLLYLRAECLYELDRYAEAKVALSQIISGPAVRQYRGGSPGEIREKLAPRRLADIYRLERDFASAEAALLSIVGRYPDDTLSWHMLGRVYLDSRQEAKLYGVIERLKPCPQGPIFGSLLLAIWHLTVRQFDRAGELIEQLVSQAPMMPMPRILRAEWLTQIGAPTEARIHACRDILRVQPGNSDARRMLDSLQVREKPVMAVSGADVSSSVVVGAGLAGV